MSSPRTLVAVLAVLLAAGCASRPYVWQRDTDGARATQAEIDRCHREAVMQANRSASFAFGWGGWGWYGPRPLWPGWGLGFGYPPGLARLDAIQDLTAFCMRVQGYRLVPLPEPGETPEQPPEGKPSGQP